MNKRAVGAEKENVAERFLTARGMRILDKNFRCRQGEIDLIGREDGYLVFVEVKYRKTVQYGEAVCAVDRRKQIKICRVADYYRLIHHLDDSAAVRYDVISIQGDEISWIKNAFLHIPRG